MASLPLWALTRMARATRGGGPKAPPLATTFTAVAVTSVSDESRRAEPRAEQSRRPCGMMRGRRPPGAREPAPSTPAGSSRPDPRPGRRRARFSVVLHALALLLCGLHLLAAAPAAAQGTPPSVPRNVQATAGDGKVTLTWQAPGSWGTGQASTRVFVLYWKLSSSSDVRDWQAVAENGVTAGFTAADTAFVFTGSQRVGRFRQPHTVANGTSYDFRIRAITTGLEGAWVTLTNLVPGVPAKVSGLSVTAGAGKLDLSWTAPANNGSAITGYDVHYKTSAAADQAGTGSDPSTGWVAASHSGTPASGSIPSLTGGTAYDVRVRAKNARGAGQWSDAASGTPQPHTYGFSPSNYDGTPGSTFNVTVSLSEAAPSGGLALTVTRLFGTALPAGLCTTGAQLVLAEADDIAAGQPTSVTVQPGQTQASFSFTFAKNGDDLVGRGECFGLQLGTSAAGWTARESAVAKFEIMIGHLQAWIAMGSNAAAMAKHTRAVAENVTGDTLKVPVTVDALPYQSTTFAIEVLSGSTATENTDFGIATKSVTFGPTTSKTQNLTVSITDDAEVEANERIELRLADGPGTLSVNDAYRRHAQGRLATITIQSEDAVPGAVRDLAIASSDTTLAVSWRVPASAGSSALTGYDVHYTSAAAVDVADDAEASGSDPSAAWVDAGHSGTTPLSMDIMPLTNGTTYRVRVRAVNASGGGAWARGTGTPSAKPSVTLSASPNPVGEGSSVTVTATLLRALTASVTIPVTVERGTSESGDHGTLSSITVAANATTGTGTITTAHDADADDETFAVALDAANLPSSVVEGSPDSVLVTITDDEKPAVSLSASPDPVTEGEAVTITATLTAALSTSVTIPVTVERVSSEAGDHGTLTSITVNANATTGTGTISTNHDTGEEDETFRVALGSPLPAAVLAGSPSDVVVRIADDEGIPAVTLAADPNPVDEGSSVTVTATLSKALASAVRIPLTLTAGTAETADHWVLSAIHIAGGATAGEGTIRTNHDLDTDDETFTVEVDTGNLPQTVRAGDPDSVLVTITDDDKAEVTLAASPNPVNEGSAVTVTARLSKALPEAVTIPLTLSRGTAEEGDYGALESITVRAGRRSATGTVTTVRDEDEEDETFTVALGSLPSSVFAGDPSSVEITIRDDGPLRAELVSSTLRPGEGSSARLTATLNHPAPAGGVRVRFHGDGGSGDNPASPVGDFTLAPAPAGESVTQWITIAEGDRRATGWLRVVNDDEPEDDETVAVWVRGSWTEDTPEIELTIPANDGGGGTGSAAWIDAEPNPVTEGRDVTIRVHLTKPLDADATIPLTVRRGTSEAGDHGTLDEVMIAAGETVGSGTIETTRDDDPDDETFTVRLGSPLPAGVRAGAASSVEVVIDDRDEPRAWLEVEPNPVDEGDPVTVTAKLDGVLTRSVTIPIEVERVTSERGDHGTLSSIRIASGRTEGTGRITTTRDDDGDDEEFTVSLGELPSGVERGHPESVEVVIVDEGGDAPATVSLGAAPDPVPEGESVTVTATLDKALERTVTIPVTVERGTSEAGDHGSLSGIRIASGQVEGTGTITTRVDDDTDDETFTVALRTNLPAGVEAGIPSSFEVTIADRGGEVPGRVRSLRVTAGDGRLDLTWSAPSSGTVTAYVTAYKKRSASEWIQLHEDDYADTKAAIEALENGTRYDVRVRASNDYGDGPWATGSGTPTGGAGSTGLRSLSVRVSKEENGTYRSLSLSPSFRSSVTAYRVTAPAGTQYAKFRPTAASSTALILVHGHEVASGAESPAISVSTGVAYWTAVIDNSEAKEYSVTFTIPSASMDAARSSVTAAVDAALAIVGELSPEDAAGALLGERSLEEDRLEALDRLGNANGRYDVGDLLAWIERCRAGGARCGNPPRTTPPASDAALPGAVGAVGAAAARRPRRRAPGGRRPKRRRLPGLAVLFAAALWSCDGAGVVDLPAAADVPVPGALAVEWTAPAGGPAAAGALVEVDGPHVGDARVAAGLELYESGQGNGPRRFVLAGDMRNGTVLEFQVPDRRQAGLYSVRVVEVAGEDHRLLEPDGHHAGIASN